MTLRSGYPLVGTMKKVRRCLELEKDTTKNLPEAPASVTARIVTDKGFHLLFTLRDSTVSGLMQKYEQFEKAILAKGWIPESRSTIANFETKTQHQFDDQPKTYTFQTKAPRRENQEKKVTSVQTVCQICGAPAVKRTGLRKDGTTWEGVFCSTGEESHKVWLS